MPVLSQPTPAVQSPIAPPPTHPLEPLSAAEISAATALLKQSPQWRVSCRIASMTLQEPDKAVVRRFQSGDPLDRCAFAVILARDTGTTYEAVVSITRQTLVSWQSIAGVQPTLMEEEMLGCEAIIKRDPQYLSALALRGITDVTKINMDCWSAGHFGFADEEGRRLMQVMSLYRDNPTDNPYAHPIEGLIVFFDLNRQEIFKIEDSGVVPVPTQPGGFWRETVTDFRTDLKPLEIKQPQGVSFQVDGHHVRWQKWDLRVGFTPREGLVLHTIAYEDQGRLRPIIHRASLSEMIVPYGDPRPFHFRKNAFDVGEYGLGTLANSLALGCDCLGEIYYFDAVLADNNGDPRPIKNAICMHEEDFGILWKHTDWRTGRSEVRRSRRLVISFIATIGNYEYGFFWYFYQDGTIQYEVKLTGIVSTSAALPGDDPRFGTLVAPGLNAPIHQHFFNVRLDMDVDGERNSVYEINTEPLPLGEENPYGNAFAPTATLLKTEQEAQRQINPFTARVWKIANPHVTNAMGQPVAYKLIPMDNTVSFAHPQSSIRQRAGFVNHHLWVTPYHPDERYATGNYPNQHPGGDGLPRWTQANRSVEDTDLVVWYTFGHHHICRLEDWPVMPVSYVGFSLKPLGFFNHNPALDVPVPAPKNQAAQGHCCHS
ncbi:MAG: primary-amine oxidase [Synechococcales cyanobacterium]